MWPTVQFLLLAPHKNSHFAYRLYMVRKALIWTEIKFSPGGKLYEIKSSLDQRFLKERVIIDLVFAVHGWAAPLYPGLKSRYSRVDLIAND